MTVPPITRRFGTVDLVRTISRGLHRRNSTDAANTALKTMSFLDPNIRFFNRRDGVSLQPTGYLPSFVDSLVDKKLLELEFLYGAWEEQTAP